MKNENTSEKPINLKDFDTSVKPEDDFFQHANGGWLDRTEIPETESRWGSFDVLHEENQKKLYEILEEIAKGEQAEIGTDRQKLRDYYRTGMDEEKIEQDGLEPVKGELEKIKALRDVDGLAKIVAHLHASGMGVCFAPSAEQDEKDSSAVVLHLYQAGLGLPDRDYYLKDDAESENIREKYRTYLKNMFALVGDEDADERARTVFDIEKKLASASKTRTELRDIEKNYHKKNFQELQTLAPNFPWKTYFEKAGISEDENIIVGQPEFLEAFSQALDEIVLEDWKTYFLIHFIGGISGKLPKAFVDEAFDFGRVFSGAKEIKPRWKRVIAEINGGMGESLGREFVERHFPPEAKTRVKEMVEYLRESYRARIRGLDWMNDETKKRALAKLDCITPKIGYPDAWRDYSGLKIRNDSYVENHLRSCRFEFAREMAKIGKPIDHNEWEMAPSVVNAYFHPTMQEIAFPAGILQPPFFYANADDAINYGGIGSVIGHELTHGFDDEGRKFDEDGNLNDWWGEDDRKQFEEQSERMRKQYDDFEPLPGCHINGKLTLGENIADLGGAVIAYHAFLKSLEGKEGPEKIDGFTARARFFLGWAKIERGKAREEYQKLALTIDPHSPAKYRINGPASNMEEFYEVFGVKEGDGLYRGPEKRVSIW